MPSRREEIDEGAFLRDWCKAPVDLMDDDDFRRLSFEAQGVYLNLLLFSLRESQIPGYFLSKRTGVPMREDEIAYDLAGSVERIEVVKSAITQLKRAKVLLHSAADGLSIPEYEDRFSTSKERQKVRIANRIRQRRRRERERQAGSTVVHLREGAAR